MIATRSEGFSLGFCLLLAAASCAAPQDETNDGTALGLSQEGEESVPALGGRGKLASLSPTATVRDYQMGDEFGKKAVTTAVLADATDAFKRAASATAKVGGATGFYLGKFGGAHVMATNHHVQPSMSCSGSSTFPLLGNLRVPCKKVYGTWPNIDLALFEITVARPEDEAKLAAVAANFTFNDEIEKGAALITVGFGIAGNSQRVMMGNQDSDCRVLSKTAEYRLMADPDEFNTASYKAWSFSHTCDISHGDSGSAMVDRRTGKPVGIVWTGRIPKKASVQSSAYLEQVFGTDHADVWNEMNYAVPATKIREHIESVIATTSTPESTRTILVELLRPASN